MLLNFYDKKKQTELVVEMTENEYLANIDRGLIDKSGSVIIGGKAFKILISEKSAHPSFDHKRDEETE